MVLSHDAAYFSRVTPPSWRAANVPHWHLENISRRILPRLRAGGATDEQVHQLMVLNPARLLTPSNPAGDVMRTSIATVCLSGTLTEKLHAAAEAGFDGVEIFEPDLVASPASPEEIVALADRLGLSLDLYQPFRDAEGVTEEEFERVLRRARAKFVLMQRLGIDTMLVCSNVGTATIDDDAVSAGQLRRLGEAAAEHGVRIAFEALAWGRYVDDYRRAWRIVELADHDAVGVCLDSFHILSRGHDPAAIEEIPGRKVFFLQLADAPALTMDVLSWSRHHRLFPGEGAFDLGVVPRARPAGRVRRTAVPRGVQRRLPADRGRCGPRARRAGPSPGSRTWSAARPPARRSPSRPASTSSRCGRRTPARSTSSSDSSASRSAAGTGARTHGCGRTGRRGSSATSSTPVTARPTLAAVGFEVADPAVSAARARGPPGADRLPPHPRHRAGAPGLPCTRRHGGVPRLGRRASEATWVPEFEGGREPDSALC